ncbi:MAG: hypothetical protein GQ581_10165 [Methyloprofundus sp.]|nr:hypothetical protein [Methyloprofundus sp.]
MKILHFSFVALSLAVTSMSAGSAPSGTTGIYNKNILVSTSTLPPGLLRSALEDLPAPAQAKALKWLQSFEFPAADVEHLRVDSTGGVFYEDPVGEIDPAIENAESIVVNSTLNSTNVFQLHSKPGASRIVYLDMDGHTVVDSVWNARSDTGQPVFNMLPYDTDGDITSFNSAEVEDIAETWKRVAEDYAPFDIDVTTEQPLTFGPNVGHILVSPRTDANGNLIYPNSSGGVAYAGVWGGSNFEYYQPALVFPEGTAHAAKYMAAAASHELGHNLGLSHDGTGTSSEDAYYGGHGSGYTSWGPIMGSGYYASITQWSKGEYPNANNYQDDIAIINGHLTYRTDDHENTSFSNATALIKTGSITVSSTNPVNDPDNLQPQNKGIIQSRTDVDLFYFDIGAGQIDLTITPSWIEEFYFQGLRGANLDINAILYNEAGTIVAQDNQLNDTFAHINTEVSAGRYILSIEGEGFGILVDGFSDYASIGQYYINGTVPEDIIYTAAPIAPTDVTAILGFDDKSIILSWSDVASSIETNEAVYYIYRKTNDSDYTQVASIVKDSTTYTDSNLENGTYSYYLKVSNTIGSNDSNLTIPIEIALPIISHVNSETTIKGLITSGSYIDTASVTSNETLIEAHQGGRPSRRVSELEHIWTVNSIQAGAVVTLRIDAEVPANTEGDNFIFSYSINGSAYSPIGTIGTIETIEKVLPSSSYGQSMSIKVVDTDKTVGNGAADTVIVHNISITSTLGDIPEQAPSVTILTPSNNFTADAGVTINFSAAADDHEDGDISTSINWMDVATGNQLGMDSSSLSISTLSVGSHTIQASVTDSYENTVATTITVIITDPNVSALGAPLLTARSSGLTTSLSWAHDCSICSYTVKSSLKAKGQTTTQLYPFGGVSAVDITESTSGTYTYIVTSDEEGAIDSNSVSVRLK